MEGSTSGQEWSPAQSTAVSHLIRQNAGWDWKRAWVKTKGPVRHLHPVCSLHHFYITTARRSWYTYLPGPLVVCGLGVKCIYILLSTATLLQNT